MNKKLSRLSIKDNSLWKMTKVLTENKNKIIPPLHGPKGIVFQNEDKAEVLAENFEKLHHLTENFENKTIERDA